MGASCNRTGTAGFRFRFFDVTDEKLLVGDEDSLEVVDEPRCCLRVRGDVGDVASEDRNVCAAGDRAGLESKFGRRAFKPGSKDGSRGKRRCRVNEPVAKSKLLIS